MLSLLVPVDISKKLEKISVPGKLEKDHHITLFYFENGLNFKTVIKLLESSFKIISDCGKIKISLSEVKSFGKGDDGYPVIIPIESDDLIEFRKKLAKKFDDNDIKYSKKWPEFKPHLTLSYSKKEFEDMKLKPKLSFQADEIVLYSGDSREENDIIVSLSLKNKKSSYLESYSNVLMKFV